MIVKEVNTKNGEGDFVEYLHQCAWGDLQII